MRKMGRAASAPLEDPISCRPTFRPQRRRPVPRFVRGLSGLAVFLLVYVALLAPAAIAVLLGGTAAFVIALAIMTWVAIAGMRAT